MGKDFKNQMNIKSLYNRFFISAAVELPLVQSFKPNHDPRTEKKIDLFFFMNKEQATSDRVQANNSQAKRGTFN